MSSAEQQIAPDAAAPQSYPRATLDALRALAQVERPTFTHDAPEIDASFTYRALTAAELEAVMTLVSGSDANFREYLVNRASIEPKVDHELWMLLGELPALVRGKLVAAVMRSCGLIDGDAEAKKDSSPIRPLSPGTA